MFCLLYKNDISVVTAETGNVQLPNVELFSLSKICLKSASGKLRLRRSNIAYLTLYLVKDRLWVPVKEDFVCWKYTLKTCLAVDVFD